MQYDNPFDPTEETEVKTSGLAIASLVCSLLFFCPITTLLGPLLGIIAIPVISSNPRRKGMGLAVAGILIGIILTAGWGFGGYKAYQFGYQFVEVVMEGPQDALTAGSNGDLITFKASFYGPGATATDEEAQAFLDTLNTRYGSFVSSQLDEKELESRGGTVQPAPGEANVAFPYLLTFSSGQVSADAEIVFADPNSQPSSFKETFINKLGYIIIRDDELGNLTYPMVIDIPEVDLEEALETLPVEITEPVEGE